MIAIIGEEEIAAPAEPDIYWLPVHGHLPMEIGVEVQPELSHADILGQAE